MQASQQRAAGRESNYIIPAIILGASILACGVVSYLCMRGGNFAAKKVQKKMQQSATLVTHAASAGREFASEAAHGGI